MKSEYHLHMKATGRQQSTVFWRERVKTETGEITLQGEIEVERGRVKI